jgi:hypothetical protein
MIDHLARFVFAELSAYTFVLLLFDNKEDTIVRCPLEVSQSRSM